MPRTLLPILALGTALLAQTVVDAQEGPAPRRDCFGDPLPTGAVARLGTTRFHRSTCAAYSPDGKTIVTADRDEVNVWDAATAQKIRRLPLNKECRGAVGLIFSHDGKKLAAISSGSSAQLWDLDNFKTLTLGRDSGRWNSADWSSSAAFSSDDKTLFTASDSTLFVWDVVTGKKVREHPWQIQEKPVSVWAVTVSEDGKMAATRGEKALHLWDPQTGNLLREIALLSEGDVLRFSKDGKTLVVASRGQWVSFWSVETGKKIHSLPVAEQIVSLTFSSDGKTLVTASNESKNSTSKDGVQVIQTWDLTNLQALPARLPAPGVGFVTISPDGNTLAWSCYDQTLRFMDRATGKDLRPTESHFGAIKALAYLPDGKRIASASDDGTVRIWDAETGRSLSVLRGHVGAVNGLALFPNGKVLASCGEDRTFRLWDLEHGKPLAVREDEGNSVRAAAFSADGKRLASGGNRGVLFLRDPATGRILDEIDASSISSLAFSPDGNTLAALSGHTLRGDSSPLLLQNLVSKIGSKAPFKRGGSSVAYSPDGTILAVAFDETLALLDTATNRVIRELPGHYNRRGCVAFSPDGRYLASVSDGWGGKANRSIRVFEIATGTEIHTFERELPIFAVAFSPDGSRLAVGGTDATAVILDLTNLTGKNRFEQLTEAELSARWERLTASDADRAYEARVDLLHAPKSAVPFLDKRLQPAPAIDAARVESLIKKLDSDAFGEREEASKELKQLGELVGAPLRKALAANPSPEKKLRLEELIGNLSQYSPAQLRSVRAIELLETIGTPDAVQVLERLAKGNPDGLATTQSRAALARKQKKSAPLPELPKPQAHLAVESPAPGPVRPDRDGDPMPAGAVARLGSARWRLTGEPRRIITFPDGKQLAVVNSGSGVEVLDAVTGRVVERFGTGAFSFGFDFRMAAAVTADGLKVATPDQDDRPGVVFVVSDRVRNVKLKIDYRRKKEARPPVPEEAESDSHGSSTLEYLSATSFSPDGNTLVGSVWFEWEASGGKARKEVKESHLIAWDTATGKELWKSPALEHLINTILFSPDGKTLTVVDQSSVRFWDAAKGRELRRWESKDALFSASYSPDNTLLATGSKESVLVWDVTTGKVLSRLAVPGEAIKAIAFSADGKLLCGGGEKTIRLWDMRTGKVASEWSDFPKPVEAVAVSGDGRTLFSGHREEHVLRRWDVASHKPLGDTSGPIVPVNILSFSHDSRTVLASTTGEEFHLWESATGAPRPTAKKGDERFTTDWLATSGRAALLRCEDGIGLQFVMLLVGNVDRFDPIPGLLGSSVDGQRILVRTEKDKVPHLTVFKVGTAPLKAPLKNEVVREFAWKDGDRASAALSPDGRTVAAAGKNVVCFFDVATGAVRRYQHPTDVDPEAVFQTQSVKFSADGSRIALVGNRDTVRIVSVKDGQRLAQVALKSRGWSGVSGLAFSPDGQTLLTTSLGDGAVAWEVATGQMIRRLDPATYVFSPDNRVLAADSRTLKVFDLYSGRFTRECRTAGNGLGNFVFSPDSQLLAVSCADTTVVVWPTSPTEPQPLTFNEKDHARVLEAGSATDAYEVIGRMIADPDRALPFMERRLHAAVPPDAGRVQRLIDGLGSEQSEQRELAQSGLTELGPLVEPALRAALASEQVPEGAQKRIEQLLQALDEKRGAGSAEDVFHIRAVQALERIGTKPARQILATIARGAELSPRTRAAAEALARLGAN